MVWSSVSSLIGNVGWLWLARPETLHGCLFEPGDERARTSNVARVQGVVVS